MVNTSIVFQNCFVELFSIEKCNCWEYSETRKFAHIYLATCSSQLIIWCWTSSIAVKEGGNQLSVTKDCLERVGPFVAIHLESNWISTVNKLSGLLHGRSPIYIMTTRS